MVGKISIPLHAHIMYLKIIFTQYPTSYTHLKYINFIYASYMPLFLKIEKFYSYNRVIEETNVPLRHKKNPVEKKDVRRPLKDSG